MQLNDKTTAKELTYLLQNNGITVSRSVVLKGRHVLGWLSRRATYCQVIRGQNWKRVGFISWNGVEWNKSRRTPEV